MINDENPFLSPQWQEMQRQYVEALSSFFPKQKTVHTNLNNPIAWNDALDFWCKSVQGELSEEKKPVFDTIMNQSKVFYSIADQFSNMLKEIGSANNESNDWQEILSRHMHQMKSMFDQYNLEKFNDNSAPLFMLTQPLASWNQVVEGVSIFPDEMMAKLMQQGMEGILKKFLSLPGIGMTGKCQEKLQKTMKLWKSYQAKSNNYRAKFSELGKLAVDKLKDNILEKASSGEKISSLREIYNMWIDANEEVFAIYVSKQEYSKLYGELVNSLVKFKKHSNELSDEIFQMLNMPTSSGVNTVTSRQHQIRKDLRTSLNMHQETMDVLKIMQQDLQKMQSKLSETASSELPKKTAVINKKKRVTKNKSKKNN